MYVHQKGETYYFAHYDPKVPDNFAFVYSISRTQRKNLVFTLNYTIYFEYFPVLTQLLVTALFFGFKVMIKGQQKQNF